MAQNVPFCLKDTVILCGLQLVRSPEKEDHYFIEWSMYF